MYGTTGIYYPNTIPCLDNKLRVQQSNLLHYDIGPRVSAESHKASLTKEAKAKYQILLGGLHLNESYRANAPI